METRTLTDKDLQKVRPWAEKMARSADITVDEVLDKIKDKFDYFSGLKSLKNKPKKFIMNRVYSKVQLDVKGIGNLQTFTGWIIGQLGQAKDWNADDYNTIQDLAKEGPKKVQELVREKKIAHVEEVVEQDGNIRKVKKAVSKLYKRMKKNKDSGEYEVQLWMDKDRTKKAYELWQPGDDVVPLDTEEFLSDGETANWNYTNTLRPNWGVNLLAVFYHGSGMVVPHITTIRVYGDYADPGNKSCILKKLPEMAQMVKFKAEMDEKKSVGDMWYLKVTDKNGYAIQNIDVPESLYNVFPEDGEAYFDLATAFTEQWCGFLEYTGNPFDLMDGPPGEEEQYHTDEIVSFWEDAMVLVLDKKKNEYVDGKNWRDIMKEDDWKDNYQIVRFPFGSFDLSTMREWHEKCQAVKPDGSPVVWKDKDGNIHQGRNYNRFALLECTIRPQAEPEEGQSIRVSVQDNSFSDLDNFNGFLPRSYESLPFAGSADVLMIVSTRKSENFYDREIGDSVPDIDGRNGDINLNVVNFLTIFVHEEEEEEGEEEEEYDEEPDV